MKFERISIYSILVGSTLCHTYLNSVKGKEPSIKTKTEQTQLIRKPLKVPNLEVEYKVGVKEKKGKLSGDLPNKDKSIHSISITVSSIKDSFFIIIRKTISLPCSQEGVMGKEKGGGEKEKKATIVIMK